MCFCCFRSSTFPDSAGMHLPLLFVLLLFVGGENLFVIISSNPLNQTVEFLLRYHLLGNVISKIDTLTASFQDLKVKVRNVLNAISWSIFSMKAGAIKRQKNACLWSFLYLPDKILQFSGDLAVIVCDTFKIEDNFVCTYIISDFRDEVLWILDQIIITPNQICGLLIDGQ